MAGNEWKTNGVELIRKVMQAPSEDREAEAERLLSLYEGSDKELVAPWLWEAVAAGDL